ncbi:MAG: D-alanyl-D-alanine carboxypeptidase family protein [Acidimicrobiia bacterium]|nr:D-alanyl-D-alanine carboxypeptidase family protein [Acidimicrobiia bacterium]
MRRDVRTAAAGFAAAVGVGLAGVVAVVAIGAGATDLAVDDPTEGATAPAAGAPSALIPSGFEPTVAGPTSTTAEGTPPDLAAAPEFPHLDPIEFGQLLDAVKLDGTQPLDAPPPITGSPEADERIRSLADARGYRLRRVASVPMVPAGGVGVHPAAAADLAALLAAARERGLVLDVRSGFREVDQQRIIFERELDAAARRRIGRSYSPGEIAAGVADETIDHVLRYHSIPGYSRHHSGRAVDLHAGGELSAFEGSPAEVWLRADNFANATRFGFVPSYPRGGELQGPQPEPWEFVHVGVGAIRCAGLYVTLEDRDAVRSCPLALG